MNRRPPQGSDRRLATRRERRERNRKKPDVLGTVRIICLLILIGQGLRIAFDSPRFRLQNVHLTGGSRFMPEEVRKLGQIELGQNIFRANLISVARNLEVNPIIREVSVTRELPSALRVEIQERKPAFQVETAAGRFHADADGVVFERIRTLSPELPVLGLPAGTRIAPGEKIPLKLVHAVENCWRLARQEKLDLRYMRVDAAEELWLNIGTSPTRQSTAARLKVRVGRATELKEKFRDIRQALIGWPNLASAALHLDVMCPGRPAYRSIPETTHPQRSASRTP